MGERTAGLRDRDAELALLAAGAAAAASGDGSLMVVEGVAGSGKTVLLEAARGLGRDANLLSLRACGSELEGDFAFGVVRQLLGGAMAVLPPPGKGGLLDSVPAARIAVSRSENAGSSPPALLPEVLHGLHQLLTGLAGHQPLQLLVDDAQWADLPSLRWLHYIRLRLDNLPVHIVVAVRTGEGPGGLPDDLSLTGAHRISLRPFGRATVATLLRDQLKRDVPDPFVDGCLLATGGNPLFVMALIDEITAQGLDLGPGAVSELGSAAVCRSVRRRLAALPVEATRYGEALAVLGNRRWPAVLQQMAAVDASAAQRSWAALVDAGIGSAATDSGFVHPIIRSSVRDGLATSRREYLHGEAAWHLRAGGATAEEVAAHLLRAPAASADFAAETLRSAARTAVARGAPDIAATYLARTLVEPLTPVERHKVLFDLGQAAAATGDVRAAEYLTAALELALTDAARASTVAVLAGVLYALGDGQHAVQLLLTEMDATSEAGLREDIEDALFEMADLDLRLRPLVADRRAQPARNVMQHSHRAVELTIAGIDRAGAIASTGIALHGGELLDGHDMYFVLVTYMHSQSDRYDLAVPAYGRAIDAAQRRGSFVAALVATAHRGRSRAYQGRLTEALADTEQAWNQAVGGEWRSVRQIVAESRAQVLLAAGEVQAADRLLQGTLEPKSVVRTTMDATALVTRGQVRARLGDLTGALDDLLTGGRHLVSWGLLNPAPYPWRSEAADVLCRLGRDDEALELAVEEVRLARRWGAARALGLALTTLGRVRRGADGLPCLAEAVRVLDGSESRLAWAEALIEYGASARRQGMLNESRLSLRRGFALALQCGALALARRARTELWATGSRPRPIEMLGRPSLTAAELRVAELAGAGQTNRAIAQALFVTVKTVEAHLSSAYRKLGIRTRAELGAGLCGNRTERARASSATVPGAV